MNARLIPRRSASEPPSPLDFDALRDEGMRALRRLCGGRWTDHNLHDPGITLLEAYAFALSELAYRSDAPLTELLSDADGRIDYAGLGLHEADAALACRASTLQDLRRWLLDRVPGLHDVRLHVGPDRDGGPPLWQLAVETGDGVGADAADEARLLREVRAAFLAQRQLGEDLTDRIELLRPQRCRLQAEIEIGGAREPAELLAELLHRAQQHLAGLPGEAVAEEGGPALRQPARALPQPRPGATRLADLLVCLRAVDGVQELPQLTLLSLDGAALQDGRLALQLPASVAELEPLRLLRRGSVVTPEPNQVLARLADLQREQHAPASAAPPPPPLPAGRAQPEAGYVSLAEQLPAVYGLGRDDPGQAAARGYIALFDQLLANAQAQLRQLPDLWSADGDLERSHWWQLLDSPGLVYAESTERLQQRAFAAFDDADARRHRALDALLALHGQVYAQNTQRQFSAHLEPAAQQRRLLDNKARFARGLLTLNRDRGAGLDPLQPQAGASGLAARLPLLLGLAPAAPGLGDSLQRLGLQGLCKQAHRSALPAGPLHKLLALPAAAPLPLPAGCRPGDRLPEPLLRAAQLAGHWLWAASARQLWLRAEQGDAGWCLGEAADLAQARALAAGLQAGLQPLIDASEGLQLLDHVLLRPRGSGRAANAVALADFHALRVSLLLPSWSLRGRQRGFRAFADETLVHNAPAHVQARCLWLDAASWLRFESAQRDWLQALQAQALRPDDGAACERLDAAAAALLQGLWPRLRRCWERG